MEVKQRVYKPHQKHRCRHRRRQQPDTSYKPFFLLLFHWKTSLQNHLEIKIQKFTHIRQRQNTPH